MPTSLFCACARWLSRVAPVRDLLPTGPAAVGHLCMQRCSKWSGDASYTILVPADEIFAVLRLADTMDKNVVGYVRVTAMRGRGLLDAWGSSCTTQPPTHVPGRTARHELPWECPRTAGRSQRPPDRDGTVV